MIFDLWQVTLRYNPWPTNRNTLWLNPCIEWIYQKSSNDREIVGKSVGDDGLGDEAHDDLRAPHHADQSGVLSETDCSVDHPDCSKSDQWRHQQEWPGDWSQWPGWADHSVGDERQSDQGEYHVPQSQTYHQMVPGHHMSIIISGHQHLGDLSQGSCQGCGHSQGNTKIILRILLLILIVFIVEQSTWLNNENFT